MATGENAGQRVCLIIGAGAGIGGNIGKTFALEGYHAMLCRRSDADGLEKLVSGIQDSGGQASGRLFDVTKENEIEDVISQTEQDIGPIEVAVYNLGAQIGNRPLADTGYKTFELGWRMGTYGLFRLATTLAPLMAGRGRGTILVTSATAAMRGNPGQHSHAAAMGGRRLLCQSLNAEFAPKGVHLAHIIIDGSVDAPDTLGKLLGPEKFAELRATRGSRDELLLPAEIAKTYLHIARQHRSAWTFELDLRPYSDLAWWNSP